MLGTPLESLRLSVALQEMDSRKSRDTRVAELESELRRTRDELRRAAAAAHAWRALVSAMTSEQRALDAGTQSARNLMDPANGEGRVRFVRAEAARQARKVGP